MNKTLINKGRLKNSKPKKMSLKKEDTMNKKLMNKRRLKNSKPKKMSLKKEDAMNKKLINKGRLRNKIKSKNKARSESKAGLANKARLGNKVKPEKVSLKNDVNFKYFFKNNERALISLLTHFLPLPKKRSIKTVKIEDSLLPPTKLKDKESIMDIRLTLDTGEFVNVEMQMCNDRAFIERVLFYWAKNYTLQLKEGESYKKLIPVYSLIFCDFNLFSDQEDFYKSFSIRLDKPPHTALNNHLRVVFVELRKFKKKKIRSLLDSRDGWCYVIRWFEGMGEKERALFGKRSKEMGEIMDWTRPLTSEEQQQLLAEAREKYRRDRLARDENMFEQGRQAVILNMLKEKLDLSVISKVTGLSEEEINKLKNGK